MWKNIGLIRYKTATIDNFTSNFGIHARKIIYRPLRFFLRISLGGHITIDHYPMLKRNAPYIFAATHFCVDEVQVILSSLDRSAYTLMGTTDQLEHNPKVYANWLTGFIFVDRCDSRSRSEAIPKMEYILRKGTSVIIFPEGGFNNTENLPCQLLFASPYYLAKRTGIPVVPLSVLYECGRKEYYLAAGEPLSLAQYDKNTALRILRDHMASLRWRLIEKYTTPIRRDELGTDPRMDYMIQRYREYMKVKWTRDVWDEELTQYLDKNHPSPKEIRASLDNIIITATNASLFRDIIRLRIEDKKYDFKAFMHSKWHIESAPKQHCASKDL